MIPTALNTVIIISKDSETIYLMFQNTNINTDIHAYIHAIVYIYVYIYYRIYYSIITSNKVLLQTEGVCNGFY